MIIKSRLPRPLKLDEPLRHGSHKRPTTRRDFLAQGFLSGAATVIAPSILGTLLRPGAAHAALSSDINTLATTLCGITGGSVQLPFICFDLAGGANIAGSTASSTSSAPPATPSSACRATDCPTTPRPTS
jgi:hypothetical protein